MPTASRTGRRRNERWSIEFDNATLDVNGQPIEDWTPIKTVWCRNTPKSATELERGGQTEAVVTHTLELDSSVAVSPMNRFTQGDRVLSVVSVLKPENPRDALVIECKELEL